MEISRSGRANEQLREHYQVEKELADALRRAGKEERKHLYTALYDELFRRVPHHPLMTQKADPVAQAETIADKVAFLKHFVQADSTFLEVGPGDCGIAFGVAKFARQVYAVDVSEEITRHGDLPENFKLVISDGTSVAAPPNSVQVAYSNQLMEHLHPDDALEQLHNIYKTLVRGGVYICVTPNGLSGPHDVSKYFDDVATGFHLKEYTTTELAQIFKAAGFSRVQPYLWLKGRLFILPLWPVVLLEKVLARLPRRARKRIAGRSPINRILSRIIATK